METLKFTLDTLTSIITSLMLFIPAFVGLMAMIASILPQPDPESKFYPFLFHARKIINIMAFNIKHAKNME